MLVRNSPLPGLFYEHQRRAVSPVDELTVGLETVVEDEGRDANPMENVDLQCVGPHLQTFGGAQAIVLPFLPGSRVQTVRGRSGELRETRAVEVIAVQPVEVLVLRCGEDLLEPLLDLGPLAIQ